MIDFQSMPPLYREPVIYTSGNPLKDKTILRPMREKTRSEYGARVVAARKHANLTQVQLAKRLGISQSTLAESETTAQGSSYTPQVAVACGVSPVWLATGKGSMIDVSGWPGTQFTLAQIHEWPEEMVQNVENFALGYLAALENPEVTVQKNSNNKFTVDGDGNLTAKLPLTSKPRQIHGASIPVPSTSKTKR
ncbi:MAG: helix-turn-helix domain-containing protein [Janthinobacterium lividum]